jgi:succinate dehydrogenase / fumarate reductase flavoprotein subunit
MTTSEQTITADVLVVGAGIAGCFAAVRARELGASITMVEQGVSGFSGKTAMGTNIHRVVLPEDDLEMALKGTVLQTDYMVDQEYAEGAIAETADRFQDVLKMGCDFEREPNGQIKWMMMVTQYPEFKQRQAIWEPFGSYKHVYKLKTHAVHLGAQVIDRTVVTDLLVSGGKVVGAVGVNKRSGDFYIFKAKAVVIATADYYVAGCKVASFTGDGMGMALRAGAQLRGMEFGRIGFGPIWPSTGPVLTAAARMKRDSRNMDEQRVRIVNAQGEEFLEQYENLRRLPGRLYGGPSWKDYIPAIIKENKEGRGPCYWDLGHVRAEIGYTPIYSQQNGGIRINPYGSASMPGLFAGGTASDMCGAVHYSIPYNLMGASITGRRAGESAVTYARENPLMEAGTDEINRLKKEAYAPLNRQSGMTDQDIRIKLIEAWPRVDYRTEANLTMAYQSFKEIEQEASSLRADDIHELVKCLKVRNIIQLAQAEALAAKERRESRLEHYRDDYPLTDNRDLKWVIVHGTGNKMEALLEDIPIEKWKYRPEPLLFDRLIPRKEA